MKKQLTAIFLVFALLLTMAGCSTVRALQKVDAAEEKIHAKLDAAEEKLEQSIRESMAPAPVAEPTIPAAESTVPAAEPTVPAAAPTVPAAVPQPSAPAESAAKLTEEQAVQIALEHVGFTADQITRLRTEYEIDDRIPQYDIEFLQGDWEYEFEIHAETGKILSFDKDHKYD